MENTNKRSINAAPNPKRKNLIQIFELPIKIWTMLPRRMNANHTVLEKSVRAKQRLKSKTGSLFMQLWVIATSDDMVMEKRLAPKVRPSASP